jgi:hypothetical protein
MELTVVQSLLAVLHLFHFTVLQGFFDFRQTNHLLDFFLFGFGALISRVGGGLLESVDPGHSGQSELLSDHRLIAPTDRELFPRDSGDHSLEGFPDVLDVEESSPGHTQLYMI